MSAPLDIDEIEARANAATPGPWGAMLLYDVTDSTEVDGPDFSFDGDVPTPLPAFTSEWQRQIHADARFVAAAREDIPALIAEVRRLRACAQDKSKTCSCHGD